MTDLFIKISTYLKQDLPFVIYSKPNTNCTIGFFQKDNHLYFLDNYKTKGFVFVSFDGATKVLIPEEFSEILIEENNFDDCFEELIEIVDKINEKDKLNFETLVVKTKEVINKAICSKVVISRVEIQDNVAFDLEKSFKRLLKNYPSAFKYCFYHPKVGMWMGASPEQLVNVKNNVFNTVALAGTKTLDKIVEEWGSKEKVEQQLVTDFILENIKSYVTEETVSSPYTAQAGNLLHIKTDISAQLKDTAFLGDVLEVLHPTPAVCGFPKNLAKDFIQQNEGYDRKMYAGYLGELNFSRLGDDDIACDLFVNLRCMEMAGKTAKIYVGCGITKDSNPELEFFETVNKSKTIKKVL